jgi:SAM-dependent methyltransferase
MIETPEQTGEWFTHAFGALYAQRYFHRDDAAAGREIEVLVDWLAPPAGATVLDVCCGGGRHLAPLREMGFNAFGVDLSTDLLALAADRLPLRGALVRADARALPFAGQFDLVLNLFTSFGYFDERADDARQLKGMVAALRSGGTLVIDLSHRAYLEANLCAHDRQDLDGMQIENHRQLTDTHVVKRSVVTAADGSEQHFVERVRLYRPAEMVDAVSSAGLADVQLFGSLDGAPLEATSERMVVRGRMA